jgi:hypothetical protein
MRGNLLAGMLFLFFTTTAFSQTATAPSAGDGTSGNPWQIATLDNLYWLTQTSAQWVAGKYFIQTADIDASATSTWFSNGSGGYYGLPIIGGNSNAVGNQVSGTFYANYDGQGHKISNLYINRSPHYIALFGNVSGSILKNLSLVSPTVIAGNVNNSSSYMGVAILVATGNNVTVTNVKISNGSLTNNSGYTYCGGLLGRMGVVTATNCTVNATITTNPLLNAGYTGVFIGMIQGVSGTFTNCYASGSVSSSNCNNIGGFVGQAAIGNLGTSSYTFTKCGSSANVSCVNYGGGFAGQIYDNTSNYIDCYATGNVTCTGGGGFYGYSSSYGANITRCYASGTVTGTSGGGFGYSYGAHNFTNCFWDNQHSGRTQGFGASASTVAGLTGKTTAEMTTSSTFTAASWDFTNIWNIVVGTNGGYPYITNIGSTLPVNWLSFTGRAIHGNVELNWSTASELNNSHFEIQRSANAIDFSTIGSVVAGTNPSVVNNYQFLDVNPLIGVSYYRLKQVDIDGKYSFSSIIQINGTPLSEIKIYSDAEALHLLVPASVSGSSIAFIYDVAGRLMQKQQVLPGRNVISTAGLSGGNYFVQLVNGGKNIYSNKFVK